MSKYCVMHTSPLFYTFTKILLDNGYYDDYLKGNSSDNHTTSNVSITINNYNNKLKPAIVFL